MAAIRYTRRGHVRGIGTALLLAGSAGAFAACGAPGVGGSESTKPSGQPVKVTFFSPASDPQGDEIMRDQTRKFNEARKDITIDYVFTAEDDNWKNYTTAMVAGSAPDVMMTYSYNPIPQWQAK